jgi:hypothetical protein
MMDVCSVSTGLRRRVACGQPDFAAWRQITKKRQATAIVHQKDA